MAGKVHAQVDTLLEYACDHAFLFAFSEGKAGKSWGDPEEAFPQKTPVGSHHMQMGMITVR